MQRDWVDYMTAFGTVGAAVVSLIAVAVALWIATSDRHQTREREQRERIRAVAQRKIDDAVAILEAWEQCWNLGGVISIVGATERVPQSKPGFDVARAHLSALLRASQDQYPLGWSAFENRPDNPEFSRALDEAPEGKEPRARWVIRREILRAIDEAQHELGVVVLKQASPDSGGRSDTPEGSDPASIPESPRKIPGAPVAP